MRFIQEFGFTVKIGQEEAHQQWLVEHEGALAASYPEGTKYLGTFATVFSTDKQAVGIGRSPSWTATPRWIGSLPPRTIRRPSSAG